MNPALAPSLDDGDWELPTFDETLFGEKRHAYALVIPVINEGERIQSQLRRIQEAALAIDIVVADGGSTDGSLKPDFVGMAGVRAVLTKTGPGKLSAQLRMAYGWCMRQGYAGVVTIDGNGKDGVEAVEDVMRRLEEGYDYIQGSRYLQGGVAENTPFEREFGNRLIHAPILSLAAGRRYTDTTNGFRGYSSRLILDPRLGLFRNVFDCYNLLFHITARAERLGFRTTEVPVSRCYPSDGDVPTKITSVLGKTTLLWETICAACAVYAPPEDAPSKLWPALAWMTVAALVLSNLALNWQAPPFTTDSWAFYSLSKSIFADFYQIGHYRSYVTGEYSAAFPPLWPAIWAIVDGVTGLGVRTGHVLNTVLVILFLVGSELVGRKLFATRWIGLAVALSFLAHLAFYSEWNAALSMPLRMVLLLAAILILARTKSINTRCAVLLGLVWGAAAMTRFDAMLPSVVFGIGLALWARKLTVLASYGAGFVAACMAWILYSSEKFGKFFYTDNTWVALSARADSYVTDWPIPVTPTLYDAPLTWFVQAIHRVPDVIDRLFLLGHDWGTAMILVALIVFLGRHLSLRSNSCITTTSGNPNWKVARPILILVGLSLAATYASNLATGYFDHRYFVPLQWLVLLTILGGMLSGLPLRRQRDLLGSISLVFVSLICTLFTVMTFTETDRSLSEATFPQVDGYARIAPCLDKVSKDKPLLVSDATIAAQLDAVHGIWTGFVPSNFKRGHISNAEISTFLDKFGFRHLYDPNGNTFDLLSEYGVMIKHVDCGPNVFLLSKGADLASSHAQNGMSMHHILVKMSRDDLGMP